MNATVEYTEDKTSNMAEIITRYKQYPPEAIMFQAAKEITELQAENAELKKNVELAVENHQICSLMDAGLIERKHRHIQDLEKENADLRKCWKCGKDDCNHRNLVAVEQVELLAVRLELSRLQAENDRLRQAMEWISVNDRLPTTSAPVMVTLGSRVVATSFYNQHLGVWYYWEGITHWQPLPLPPEPTDE